MGPEIVLTPEGAARLERELERLRAEGRDRVADRLRHAVEMGRELNENAEYLAAKEEQERLEQRIVELERRLGAAEVAERPPAGTVGVGVGVRVRDRSTGEVEEYEIVGSGEGARAAGRISRESPIGSALVGRGEGELVDAATPGGVRRLEILGVR